MANPYQQQGGYAPQYYVPAGAMYPGAYYPTPQGYVAAPAAAPGQQYGQIYAMPNTVQYAVPQQQPVRALANPLDAMFGAKPAAVALAPTVSQAAPAPSAALKPQAGPMPYGSASWMTYPSPAGAPPTSAIAAYSSVSTDFGSFASAPMPVVSQPARQMTSSSTVLAPLSMMTPTVPIPKPPAPVMTDNDFGSFVPPPKPSASISTFAPSSVATPSSSFSYASSATPLPSAAPKVAPPTTTAAPVRAPEVVQSPPPVVPTPAPPVAVPPVPTVAPSHSAPAAPTPANAKTSKKAVDWNNVNYASVFADIDQFTPVTSAPISSAPTAAPLPVQEADDWGSFQASPAQPTPSSAPTPQSTPSVPAQAFAQPLLVAATAQSAATEWGPMAGAPQSQPSATSSTSSSSLLPSASVPLHSSMPSFTAASQLPPSAAQTASALFSSFSGFPASSPLASLSATPAGALQSTGLGSINAPTTMTTVAAVSSIATSAAKPSTEYTNFSGFSSAPSAPISTTPPASAVTSFSSFTSSVLKSSPPTVLPQTPVAAADDFGEFASATPVPTSNVPPASAPPPSFVTSSTLSSASSAAFSAGSLSGLGNVTLVTPAADFGDFAAPLPPVPATQPAVSSSGPARSSGAGLATPAVSSVLSSVATFAPAIAPTVASAVPAMPDPAALSTSPTVRNTVIPQAPAGDVDFGDFSAPISPGPSTSLSTGAVSSFTPLAAPQLSPRRAAEENEWGSFETAPPAALPPPAFTPVKAEAPRAPPMSAEALLGRAMKALDTRSEDDFGSFSSPVAPPAVPAAKGMGFGFLFAGPPLASALQASPGSPMVALSRPEKPASEALPDVLRFLVLHERFEEALACKAHMEAQDKRSSATEEQVRKWRSAVAPAGHLTMADMRKKLADELGAAGAEKYAHQFVDFSESASTDLNGAAMRHRQALAFMKRLLATKGADLSDARRAALQAIAAELAVAQEFASLVLLKSSIAGLEEEAVKRGVWSSQKGTNFFRALSELHVVYRRISHAIKEEGSDLTLSALQASVSVAWNALFATLANEASRVEQDTPLTSAKDAAHFCGLCGLTGAQAAFHTSCQNLQRHAASRQ